MKHYLKSLLIAGMITAGSSLAADAGNPRQTYDYASMPATVSSALTADLVVDSIMFRPDVTRVYGRLTGIPHTSARIDGFTITADPTGRRGQARATDIDGFDFERRFQWEDSGSFPVEIDFPAMTAENSLIIDALFPGGKKSWKVTRVVRRKQR